MNGIAPVVCLIIYSFAGHSFAHATLSDAMPTEACCDVDQHSDIRGGDDGAISTARSRDERDALLGIGVKSRYLPMC